MSDKCISASCRKLSAKYKDDLTDCLKRQINHIKSVYNPIFERNLESLGLLNAIYDMGGEHVFTKMKLINKTICALLCMSQDRLVWHCSQ